jgi:hypothetical protein
MPPHGFLDSNGMIPGTILVRGLHGIVLINMASA